ncbi:adenylate/guanylate cyclase domain-containing protein [Flavivirga spongiicola]|uniref:Adenylate/guanylate cyclase domain-containing protein n=1 Tax=Flavivirga spongiicola TaxID=421621 RepID=A0ABU7XZI3_9FLAO|nr:adenylate/guanylate cyclase domain-containing protein [Flavivirga sp. MEBiC05379]MDO5980987.1 adenylate/guanylate cyclase domain-containing protein [Flavivirga sp. MEBiC05379]
MQLHPLYKRHFGQILSFGIIWLFFGLTYVMIEYGLLGTLTLYPVTGSLYSPKNSLIMVCVGGFLMGLIQGSVEIFWLKKYFTHTSFWIKILFKSIFYLFFVVTCIILLSLINNAYLYKTSIFDPIVIDNLLVFMNKFVFWSVIIYIGIILDIALFYSEIKDYLGKNVLSNYLGKYHKPKQETRIFMFLDMKSSTTIAENLGHKKYFELLKTYYADMTNAILETSGEVYQYVGDEIVITWKETSGIYRNNCIHCFRKISEGLDKKRNKYIEQFGLVPEFKAGYHIGMVTTGEIGIIKKDLIYTGDILNTSARIQEECNNFNSKVLISEDLSLKLKADNRFSSIKVENLLLRGKKQPIQLYQVAFN